MFDAGARRLLRRAYARPGQWVGTRIANPSPAHLRWARAHGIDLYGRDLAPGGEARNRWMRGFIRSVYYQQKWYYREGQGLGDEKRLEANRSKALRYQVGTVRLERVGGEIVNRGRAVRIIILAGGSEASRAAERTARSRKIFVDGAPGPRWAGNNYRDW